MSRTSILIPIPVELVELMNSKVRESGFSDLIECYMHCLRENIKTLREAKVIFKEVTTIKDIKYGEIGYGHFTRDIIKYAVLPPDYKARKNVIKGLIIAAFGEKWQEVFDRYYDLNGDLKKDEASGKVEKNSNFTKHLRTTTLKDWSASANFSTPQWANYIKIPIEGGFIKRIRCQIITTSEYYRFGFKLFRKSGRLFGDGSIQSMDNNFVIHYGKNFLKDDLFITTYRNGIRQRPDKYNEAKPFDNHVNLELFIDDESILYLLLNGIEVFKLLINKEIREQIYMLAWGDGNEFQLKAENIEVEFEVE